MEYDHHLKSKRAVHRYERGLNNQGDYYPFQMHRYHNHLVKKIAQKYRPKKSLDFACGTGRITESLEKFSQKSYAIDISEEAINVAKQKCRKTQFYIGNYLSEEEFPHKDIDLVTSFRFILNTPYKDLSFSFFNKVMIKKGLLLFNVHRNSSSIKGLITRTKIFFGFSKEKKVLSFKEVTKLLHRHGFELIDYYGFGLLSFYKNVTLLPKKHNTLVERWLTNKKVLRKYCFDVSYLARKK